MMILKMLKEVGIPALIASVGYTMSVVEPAYAQDPIKFGPQKQYEYGKKIDGNVATYQMQGDGEFYVNGVLNGIRFTYALKHAEGYRKIRTLRLGPKEGGVPTHKFIDNSTPNSNGVTDYVRYGGVTIFEADSNFFENFPPGVRLENARKIHKTYNDWRVLLNLEAIEDKAWELRQTRRQKGRETLDELFLK